MLKNTLFTLSLILITVVAVFAQQKNRQMQKLETNVEIEYANFVDVNTPSRLADVVSIDEFANYIRNSVEQKTVFDYASAGFSVRENGIHSIGN